MKQEMPSVFYTSQTLRISEGTEEYLGFELG